MRVDAAPKGGYSSLLAISLCSLDYDLLKQNYNASSKLHSMEGTALDISLASGDADACLFF